MSKGVRVLLVEDNKDFASNFRELVLLDPRLDYLGHAGCKASGISMALEMSPDIVIMDLNLSGSELDGIEAAREIRIKTGIQVLLLSAYENEDIMLYASKKAFASGYVFKKHFENIADIIYQTATSNTVEKIRVKDSIKKDLTSAEEAVFRGLIDGDVYKYSRATPSTIEKQLSNIYRKLGVRCGKDLQKVFENW